MMRGLCPLCNTTACQHWLAANPPCPHCGERDCQHWLAAREHYETLLMNTKDQLMRAHDFLAVLPEFRELVDAVPAEQQRARMQSFLVRAAETTGALRTVLHQHGIYPGYPHEALDEQDHFLVRDVL